MDRRDFGLCQDCHHQEESENGDTSGQRVHNPFHFQLVSLPDLKNRFIPETTKYGDGLTAWGRNLMDSLTFICERRSFSYQRFRRRFSTSHLLRTFADEPPFEWSTL